MPGKVIERLEVDVVPLEGDEHSVGQHPVVMPCTVARSESAATKQRTVPRVDQQHLTRPEPPALDDLFRRHRHDAGLRSRGAQAVAGSLPAQRPEAVPVKGRADHDPVTERESCGSVPRLESDRLVAVEIAHRRGEVSAPLPCLGDEAHQRLAHLPTSVDKQLERVVERGGVRPLRPDHPAQLGLELGLAGVHPRPVSRNRVDLAVVREHAERLGESPVRHRVGRVALVEDRQAALAGLVVQVQVEVGEPSARHQALVHERAARARRDVHPHALLIGALFGTSPDKVEAALPFARIEVWVFDEAVPDRGHRLACSGAKRLRVDGDGTPSVDLHARTGDRGLDHGASALVPFEQRDDGIWTAEQTLGNLDQQPRAVAALAVRVQAAAVREACERGDAKADGFMAELGRGHKAHSTCGPAFREVTWPREAR